MQILTKTFSKAVNNSTAKKKVNSCSTNIPHDPLNASRLELESLLSLLASMHQNCQWFLVTAYHFATKSDYVTKLATATTQTIESTATCMAELESLAGDLKIQGSDELHGTKKLLNIIENLVVEIEDCLNKFNARREVFQSAVHCQLKIKKLDFEISKYEGIESAPVSLLKDLEKQKRKVEQLKLDFRGRNAALKADIDLLLERARPLSVQILESLLRHEASLYDKLADVSKCIAGAEEVLQKYRGNSDLLHSAASSDPKEPPSFGSSCDPYAYLTSRLGKRLVPASIPSSPAQLFLLTAREPTPEELTRDKQPSGASDETVTKCPSVPRESRASVSSGILEVDDACEVSDKRPVIVPLLRLSGANVVSEGFPSPASSRMTYQSAIFNETRSFRGGGERLPSSLRSSP